MKYPIIAICCATCLCGCKSKKVATDYHEKTIVNSEVSAYHNVATIDTTRLLHIEDLKQIITIEEDVIVTEYDKETGKAIKETETKRKIIQDTNKVASKEEQKGKSVVKNDSTHHVADASKMIDSEVKEESTGGQEAFGKWLGIVLGIAIVGYVIYLCIRKKLRLKMFG